MSRKAPVECPGSSRYRSSNYKLFAWDDINTYEWFDPALLDADENRGISLELK